MTVTFILSLVVVYVEYYCLSQIPTTFLSTITLVSIWPLVPDIGGAANNFQTTYIVADKSFEFIPMRISAGYGQSKIASGIMDGPFGGVEIEPLSFLQLTGEYDATELHSA